MELEKMTDELVVNILKRRREVLDIVKDCILSDDEAKINSAIINHPAIYAFFSTHYALAKIRTLRSHTAMEDYTTYNSGRIKKHFDLKGKKYTETTVKQLAQDDKFKELREEYFKAYECELILQSAVRSLEQKKDMLFSVASNMRAELKAGIRIASDQIENMYKGKNVKEN